MVWPLKHMKKNEKKARHSWRHEQLPLMFRAMILYNMQDNIVAYTYVKKIEKLSWNQSLASLQMLVGNCNVCLWLRVWRLIKKQVHDNFSIFFTYRYSRMLAIIVQKLYCLNCHGTCVGPHNEVSPFAFFFHFSTSHILRNIQQLFYIVSQKTYHKSCYNCVKFHDLKVTWASAPCCPVLAPRYCRSNPYKIRCSAFLSFKLFPNNKSGIPLDLYTSFELYILLYL